MENEGLCYAIFREINLSMEFSALDRNIVSVMQFCVMFGLFVCLQENKALRRLAFTIFWL